LARTTLLVVARLLGLPGGLTALFAMVIGAPPACADTPVQTYVVGVEDINYMPGFAVRDGQYIGYARDLLDAFAADVGVTFTYQPMPVPRLYASLAADQIDFKFPDNPTWNADFRQGREIIYSDPLFPFLDASVVLADRADTIGIEDIKTLGTITGFAPWPWMDRVRSGAVDLVENANLNALVRQVLAGRVDAAYADVAFINRILDQEMSRPGALAIAPSLPSVNGQYLMSTIQHLDVIATFDAWMANSAARIATLKEHHGVERGLGSKE